MDEGRVRSQQESLPQGVMIEGDAEQILEYHHHRHHHRSHHHRQSPQPGDVASGAEVLTSNALVQPGMPHSTLKARAIMTADNILIAGVANKWNLTGPPDATGKKPVFGLINFEETPQGVHITGHIEGLGQETLHGFHVHEFGDVSSGCTTAGAHFNPFNHVHGGLNDAERHVGDLGNITADANGVAHLNILNPMMSLHGEHSIVGRAIVVHAMPDDLGRGGNEESTKTGNSGARLACGIIRHTNSQTA